MTWEEIIIKIRTQPEYKELVEKAYFEEDLKLNVERFKSSEEYTATKKIIEQYSPGAPCKIVDIGAGNGIASVAFALDGYNCTAVEPDVSLTIGSGAIRKLKEYYNLENLTVIDSFGEKLPFEDQSFNVVYIRQAMHHAADLNKFVSEASRVLKSRGLFLSVRDHVIYDDKDKSLFLDSHPLHKFYGGENAFTEQEYTYAIKNADLEIQELLKYYESVINYFPMTEKELENIYVNYENKLLHNLKNKIGLIANIAFVKNAYKKYVESKNGKLLDERSIPGRIYSYIALKK